MPVQVHMSVNVHVYIHGSQRVCERRIRCLLSPDAPGVYMCNCTAHRGSFHRRQLPGKGLGFSSRLTAIKGWAASRSASPPGQSWEGDGRWWGSRAIHRLANSCASSELLHTGITETRLSHVITQAGTLLRLFSAPAHWSHRDTFVVGTQRHLCYIPGSQTGLVSLRVVKHGDE